MRRSFVVAVSLLTACQQTRNVERPVWPGLNGSVQQPIEVRLHSGGRYELRSYSFTNSGLVAATGRQTAAKTAPLDFTSPVVISYDSISVVRVSTTDTKRTLLASALATTAAYFIIAQMASDERPAAQPRPTSATSCPFIYSFDGKNWHLDSETYAGAISRGLERTETDNLDHIALVDGRYRLRLANMMDETEYTDELALLVADHPSGTRVFPDAEGNLHIAGSASSRLSSRYFNRVSVPARSVWEASFSRPTGGNAALIVTVRNTDAAPFILGEILNTLGRDVYSFYHEINTNSATAARTADWFRSMGGLSVSKRSSGEWRQQALLPAVGPAVAKTFIVPLDTNEDGDVVTVRFEASPMVWKIDKVELAEYLGQPVVRKLAINKAIDGDGADVTEPLSTRDGRYHVAMKGSRVTIEFDAGEQETAMKQTVMASITGHYYANSQDSRRGDRALVTRLMTKSAFSQGYFATKYLRHRLLGE